MVIPLSFWGQFIFADLGGISLEQSTRDLLFVYGGPTEVGDPDEVVDSESKDKGVSVTAAAYEAGFSQASGCLDEPEGLLNKLAFHLAELKGNAVNGTAVETWNSA